jgi:hypothetical protein
MKVMVIIILGLVILVMVIVILCLVILVLLPGYLNYIRMIGIRNDFHDEA